MSTYNRTPYTRRRVRRRKAKTKRFTRGMRITLFAFFVLFLVTFFALIIRIYMIDYRNGDRYKKAALSQQSYTNTVLNYQRGAIVDCNNTTLAVSIRKYNLVLEPRTLNTDEEQKAVTVNAIVEHFGIEKEKLDEVIADKPNSMYEHLDELKKLDSKTVEAFEEKMEKDKNIQGVWSDCCRYSS